jgi:DNA invertase Pin-like site-specific DNA recombinase
MRIAIYLRVSKTRQELANQRHQMLAFIAAQPSWKLVRDFSEKKSGMFERAALDQAMQAADRREYDLLFFWSLDRLSREGPLKTLLYLERLRRVGIGFKSYTEPFIDSEGPGELFVIVLAWIAQQESVRRGERIRAAFQRIKQDGKTRSGRPIGRPTRMIPLETLQLAQKRRAEGNSWSYLSQTFRIPSSSLRAALQKASRKSARKKS